MAMIEDGDRTCPLCTEEMDLTDQQLKPCKCGYDICVWCWHQIMEMAEKEGSEGRCPACRTIYDKQKIIATDNCKRMVTEEKKQKSQRTKNKPLSTIEDRKQLSNVRVVQRNLAYIMGMPSHLADEAILECKEYFGQYGKVLKVSISRQAGTTLPQASTNDTFNVYITYAREEEAIRCIQYVHNFVLEDRPLRACFGTTKYCYIWLRNMVCNNPDCVYLHDIGSQEDSFTKDEIISAYTRSRVPQIPSNCLQLRAGDVLPPPTDDFHNNNTAAAKPPTKNSYNITINQAKGSHVDTGSTSSTVFPSATSWASRVSSFRSPISSAANLQNTITQKIEIPQVASNSTMNTSAKQKSAWHEDRSRVLEPLKNYNGSNSNSRVQDVEYNLTSAWEDDMPSDSISDRNETVHANGESRNPPSISDSPEEISFKDSRHSAWDDDIILHSSIDGETKIVANGDRFRSLDNDNKDPIPCGLSGSLDEPNHAAYLPGGLSSSLDEPNHANLPCDLSSCVDELNHVDLLVTENNESLHLDTDTHPGSDHIEMSQQKRLDIGDHLAENFATLTLSFQEYRENKIECLTSLPEIDAHLIHEKHVLSPLIPFNHLTTSHNSEAADKFISVGDTSITRDCSNNEPLYVNGISEPNSCTKNSLYLSDFDNNSYIDNYSKANKEEKSAMPNMLSSDYDPWDNSWSSANNFAELLAQMNSKHDASSNQSSSLKVQDTNQSRFSFARQDNYQQNLGYGEKIAYSNQESYGNTLLASNFERANVFGNNGFTISPDATSGITRSKKSPPPGFTLPNTRAPPPGFSSPDRYDQALNTFSDTRLLNIPLQNHFQIHSSNNTADVEFIDPAILAVGKGRLPLESNNVTGLSSRSSTLNPHFNTKDNDSRIQLLMQQSIYSNYPSRSQNNTLDDRFLQRGDAYSNSRQSMQNPSISSYSHISQQPLYNPSSQWNGWSDAQINSGMDERFRLNSYFQSNEESKFHTSKSGDFYNRTFGI